MPRIGPTQPSKTTGPAVSKPFNPTPEQSGVIEQLVWYARFQHLIPIRLFNIADTDLLPTQRVLRVRGVPGCGKTATNIHAVVAALQVNPDFRIKSLAFNTDAADEIKARLKPYGHERIGSSTHGFGYSIVSENYGRLQLNGKKYYEIVDRLVKKSGHKITYEIKSAIVKFADRWRNELLTPTDDQQIRSLSQDYSFGENLTVDQVISLTWRAIQEGMKDPNTVDYTDMIALPFYLQLKPRHLYDMIIVDEYQDNNKAQDYLVRSCCRTLVVIGDQNQAIYAFRGAGTSNMEDIINWADTTGRHYSITDLTYNFRSDLSIISLANTMVPDIKPGPNAGPGVVEFDLDRYTILERCQQDLSEGDSVKILARRNAPLVQYLLRLILAHIPAYRYVGQDEDPIMHTLRDAARSASAFTTMADAVAHITFYFQDKISKLKDKGEFKNRRAIDTMMDCWDCMKSVLEVCTTPLEIDAYVNKLTPRSPQPGAVELSTIHRAKGTEADSVFIVGLDYFGPNAIGYLESLHPMSDVEAEQEDNLVFVAITRPKHKLRFSGTPYMFKEWRDQHEREMDQAL